MYIYIYVTQFGKTTLVEHNNFEQTLTFKHSLFGHFAQEINDIWYPGRLVNASPRSPRYQMSFIGVLYKIAE